MALFEITAFIALIGIILTYFILYKLYDKSYEINRIVKNKVSIEDIPSKYIVLYKEKEWKDYKVLLNYMKMILFENISKKLQKDNLYLKDIENKYGKKITKKIKNFYISLENIINKNKIEDKEFLKLLIMYKDILGEINERS